MRKIKLFFSLGKHQRHELFLMKLSKFFHLKWGYASFGEGSCVLHPMRVIGKKNVYIGKNVRIYDNMRLEAHDSWHGEPLECKMQIGDNVSIGQNAHIVCTKGVIIEKDVVISPNCSMIDSNHTFTDLSKSVMEQPLDRDNILIKEGAWLGVGVVVLKGVTIGKHAVIGANAVVTHDIPDYSVAVGIPARTVSTLKGDQNEPGQ